MPTPRRPRRSAAALASAIAAGSISSLGLVPATAAESTTHLTSLSWLSATNGHGPVERDRSNGETGAADGRTLTLQGRTFSRGLGVHANSEVVYTVPAGCTRFSSVVGLDDEVGNKGSVVFSVFEGSKQLFASTLRRGNSPNLDVSVPVTPGGRLRLVVTDGGDSYSYDHADWADARLTCTTPAAGAALVPNGGADVDTAGWSAVNASLARSTDVVRSGAGAFRLTATATGHALLMAQPVTGGITPGASITVSAWVRSAVAPRGAVLQADFSSSTGYLTTASTPTVRTTTSGWTQLSATMTVPASAVRAQFYVKVLDAAAGEVHLVDDVSISGAAAPGSPSPTATPAPTASPTVPPTTPSVPTPTVPPTVVPTTPAQTAGLVGNGGADVDTVGWSAVNAPLTRSTDVVRTGAGAFRLTTAANGHVLLMGQPVTSGITGGATLSVSAWVRSAAVPRSAVLQADFSGTSGYLTTGSTPTERTGTSGWTQLTGTVAVPASATRAQFYVKVVDAAAGEVHLVDDIAVTGSTPTATPSPTAPAAPTAPPTVPPTTPTTPTSSGGPAGQAGSWQTIFNDDFDGTALDAGKWSDHEPWQGGGYLETGSWNPSPHTPQQIAVGGGQAALKARRGAGLPQGSTFTSAHINTRGKFSIPAGVTSYTEARLKAPSGKGLLPGFWLLGNGDSGSGQGWPITGEIDILEFANNGVGEAGSPFWSLWYPKDVYTNAPGTWMNATHVYHVDSYRKRFDLYDTYHTWGLYRSPEKMELYIDGVKIATYRPNEVHNDNIPLPSMLFSGAQHIRLSLIVGGWAGQGLTEPQYQEGDLGVDYVKVWRQTSA